MTTAVRKMRPSVQKAIASLDCDTQRTSGPRYFAEDCAAVYTVDRFRQQLKIVYTFKYATYME